MGLIAQDMHDVGRTFNDARSIAPSNDGREKPSNFDVFFGFKLFGDLYGIESNKIRVVVLLRLLIEKVAQSISIQLHFPSRVADCDRQVLQIHCCA